LWKFHVFIDILEIVAYKRPQNYLLSRSRGNDHVLNASVENRILSFARKQSYLCVTGIAQMVNKPCSLEIGTLILLGDLKFIALQRF
jgi:hypothetical protein